MNASQRNWCERELLRYEVTTEIAINLGKEEEEKSVKTFGFWCMFARISLKIGLFPNE